MEELTLIPRDVVSLMSLNSFYLVSFYGPVIHLNAKMDTNTDVGMILS
jgi:hypothetical protein